MPFPFSLFNKNNKPAETPPNTLTESIKTQLDEINTTYAAMAKALTQDCQNLTIGADTTAPTQSRIGGIAWLPEGMEYPTGKDGTPMVFLLQVNLRDITTHILPTTLKSGLLQFYIEDSDNFGCEFPSTPDNGFKILHITKQDTLTARPQDLPTSTPLQWANSHKISKAIHITPGTSTPSTEDFRFQPLLKKALTLLKEAGVKSPWSHPLYPSNTHPTNHNANLYMLGNPHFTQSDFRLDFLKHTVSLLSIGFTKETCIGDAGEMHFLIPPKALARGDLSQILYYWDCH